MKQPGSTPLRPLHVGKFVPPPFAGIESHIDTLLRSLVPMVETATLVASEAATPSAVRRANTPYRLLGCRSFGTIASTAVSPSLRQVVKDEFDAGRANLLHIHTPNPWADLAAIDSHYDTPVVMTWHSDVVGKPNLMRLYSGIQRRALQRADRIVIFTPKHFDSSDQLKRGNLQRKLVQIPLGIDFCRLDTVMVAQDVLADIDTWLEGRSLLLSVGRQVHYKGYRHLINAMKLIHSNAALLMIGTGPLSAQLQKHAAAEGLQHRVRFLGEVDQSTLVTALRRCDIFCLPSIEQSEAFGIASAEAMAFAKPTIVCELGNGVNYLNKAGVTSLVTPPRDEKALADAIDLLIEDEGMRAEFGAAASMWVRRHFDVELMRDRTLAMYRSLF